MRKCPTCGSADVQELAGGVFNCLGCATLDYTTADPNTVLEIPESTPEPEPKKAKAKD